MANMHTLGVDPDMHNIGLAVVEDSQYRADAPVWVGHVRSTGSKDNAAVVDLINELCRQTPQLSQMPTPTTIVVESQEIYKGGKTKNPMSILRLANCAGATAMYFRCLFPNANLIIVNPKEWKGQVDKLAHQARTLRNLGWAYDKVQNKKTKDGYCFPVSAPSSCMNSMMMKKGDWKHIMDAIGLALWHIHKDDKKDSIEEELKRVRSLRA